MEQKILGFRLIKIDVLFFQCRQVRPVILFRFVSVFFTTHLHNCISLRIHRKYPAGFETPMAKKKLGNGRKEYSKRCVTWLLSRNRVRKQAEIFGRPLQANDPVDCG